MPTGPIHGRQDASGEWHQCRCMVGQDHDQNGWYEDDDSDESLSVSDAADIWRSNGMDEDYMFGYSDDELRIA